MCFYISKALTKEVPDTYFDACGERIVHKSMSMYITAQDKLVLISNYKDSLYIPGTNCSNASSFNSASYCSRNKKIRAKEGLYVLLNLKPSQIKPVFAVAASPLVYQPALLIKAFSNYYYAKPMHYKSDIKPKNKSGKVFSNVLYTGNVVVPFVARRHHFQEAGYDGHRHFVQINEKTRMFENATEVATFHKLILTNDIAKQLLDMVSKEAQRTLTFYTGN